MNDKELIKAARAGLPALVARIPADGVRVDVTDVCGITRYSIDGETIPWDIVKTVGAVHATRPGERESFWFEIVAYVPAAWLSELRKKRKMEVALKESAARKRAAVNGGSR